MIFEQFIENLESGYDGKFGKADLIEIRKFINDNELTGDQIGNWYDIIRREWKQQKLPRFSHLMDYWENAKNIRRGNLHPQSPLQMLYRYQDKSAKWLIDKCAEIRRVQSKRELLSREISFIVIWERLKDIIEDFQEQAKQRIIDNGDKELYEPVNLNDIMIDFKPTKIEFERKKETIKIDEIIEEAF